MGQQLRDPQQEGVREGLRQAVLVATESFGGLKEEAPGVVDAVYAAYVDLWYSHETQRFKIGQPRTPKQNGRASIKREGGGGRQPSRKRQKPSKVDFLVEGDVEEEEEDDEQGEAPLPILPLPRMQEGWAGMSPYIPPPSEYSGLMNEPLLAAGPYLDVCSWCA